MSLLEVNDKEVHVFVTSLITLLGEAKQHVHMSSLMIFKGPLIGQRRPRNDDVKESLAFDKYLLVRHYQCLGQMS